MRGVFGSTLKRLDEAAYARFFAPTAAGLGYISPSGLRDLPRPFVFRLREDEVVVNLFAASELDLVCRVMEKLGISLAASPELLRLPLEAAEC